MSDEVATTETSDAQELPQDVPNAANEVTKAQAQKQAPKITPVKIKNVEFKSEDDAWAEIERGRQSGRLLTEAQKRLEASTKKDRERESQLKEVRANHKLAAQALGLSREEAIDLFSKYLWEEELLPQKMSPEAKRARELEEENKKLKGEREAEQKRLEKEAFDKQVAEHSMKLRAELEGVLKERKVPNTRLAVRRLANYMQSYQAAGVEIPAAQAADMVMQDYQQEFSELLDEASPEQLEAFLGKERMQKLVKRVSAWALSKVKGAKVPTPDNKPAPQKPTDKKISPQEFNKFIGGLG